MSETPYDYLDEYDPDDYEPDEDEEAMENCHGCFERDGVFWCGAAGSEDCDWECPFSKWVGLTQRQIDELDSSDSEGAKHG